MDQVYEIGIPSAVGVLIGYAIRTFQHKYKSSKCKLNVAGSNIEIDLTDSSPQPTESKQEEQHAIHIQYPV